MRFIIVFLCVLYFPITAHANKAADLLESCNASDVSALSFCTGVIGGVIDGFNIAHDLNNSPKTICFPDGFTNKQMIEIYRKFANENPEHWHKNASFVVLLAARQAFPCSKSAE